MFKEETLAKKLLTKGFWLYLLGFLIVPSGYFIRVLVSNDLSVADVGTIYTVLGLMTFLTTYNDLGLSSSMQYFLPKYREEKKLDYFKSSVYISFGVQLLSSIALGLLFYYGAPYISEHYFQSTVSTEVLQMFMFYFIGFTFFKLLSSLFMAFQDTFNNQLISLVRMWSIFGFTLFFFLTNTGSIQNYLYARLFGVFLALTIFATIFIRKYSFAFKRGTLSLEKTHIFTLQKYAFWMLLGSQAAIILGQIDLQMILFFIGAESAGYYTNYQSMMTLYHIIVNPLIAFLLPVVSQLIAKNEQTKLSKLINLFYKYFSVLAICIGGFYLIYGDVLASLLFGTNFIFSGHLLSIAGFFVVLKVLFSINFSVINAFGAPKKRVIIIIYVAILNVILNYFLINSIGIRGAVISTILGWGIMFIASFKTIQKYVTISYDFSFLLKNTFYLSLFLLVCYLVKEDIFELRNGYRYYNLIYLLITILLFAGYMLLINKKSVLLLKNEITNIIGRSS